jgi:hypothetical protein
MPVDTSPDHEDERGSVLQGKQILFSTESFRVRCPHCRKLYLVQFNDVQEAKPRFECSQCHDRFWLSLPDMDLSSELVGLPLKVKEAPLLKAPVSVTSEAVETESCPKCFKSNALHARECGHCSVLIAKAKAASLSFDEPIPTHSAVLKGMWQKIVDDYGDEKLHADFIRASERERNIPYAAAQYGQMQKLMPTDEITKQRINEIQALAETLMPPGKQTSLRPKMYPRLWQIPLLGAAILIIVGLTLPMFRNIVGLGAAFLFLGVAMQLQLRRRDNWK